MPPFVDRLLRLNLKGAFLPLVALPFVLGIASYVFVWIDNPYALRPWGHAAKLADRLYTDNDAPLVYPTAARDGTDLVLIGGSTSSGYTPAMLRSAFPDARAAANLSFQGVDVEDMKAELAALERSPSLGRVIISLEMSLAKEIPTFGRIVGKPPYDNAWFNPVPEYGQDALEVAVHELRTDELAGPGWVDPSSDRPDFMIGVPPMSHSLQTLAVVARDVGVSRAWVTRGAPEPACATMPLSALAPDIRRLAARGVRVDILAPPYSLSIYSSWTLDPPPAYSTSFRQPGTLYADMVALRRCAVEMTAGLPNVRVHALDTDRSITANLGLYRDSGHLVDPDAFRAVLVHVAAGNDLLTLGSWPAYESTLAADVQDYDPRLPPPPGPL